MNKYRTMILEGLQKRYPTYEIKVETMKRNNGCTYDGICMRESQKICYAPILPCRLYEELLEYGESTLEEVLDEMELILKEYVEVGSKDFTNWKQIKESLIIRVINYEKNKELLQEVPHRRILDLAVTYRMVVSVTESVEGSALATNSFLHTWGVAEEELFTTAYQNMFQTEKVSIHPLTQILVDMAEMVGYDGEGMDLLKQVPQAKEIMYVAKVGLLWGGGVCFLQKEAFQKFAEEKDSDIYILPSSTHELILVLENCKFAEEVLKDMVKDINASMVSEEEILSNHVYLYQRETNEIVDLGEAQ